MRAIADVGHHTGRERFGHSASILRVASERSEGGR
jgi:hypothetical protein